MQRVHISPNSSSELIEAGYNFEHGNDRNLKKITKDERLVAEFLHEKNDTVILTEESFYWAKVINEIRKSEKGIEISFSNLRSEDNFNNYPIVFRYVTD